MGRAADESKLATWLCTEMLGAAELKALARARGFPAPAGTKDEIARSVAARLLEPVGVAEAMAQLDGTWLAVLHVLAAADDPVPLSDVASAVAPDRKRHFVDARRLWRQATDGLLTKGVVLADEEAVAPSWQKSRFARLRLLVPADFRRFLPPFPVASAGPGTPGETGRVWEVLRGALVAFLSHPADGKATKATDLIGRLAARFKLEDGRLGFAGAEHVTSEILLRHATACWEAGLVHRGRFGAPVPAGRMARHILAHLPPGHACGPKVLANGLAGVGIDVTPVAVADFCADGAAAGLLRRFSTPTGETLFAACEPPAEPVADDGVLALAPHGGGVRVNAKESSVIEVLRAAGIAHATTEGASLVLEPDPVRLGRSWDDPGVVRSATALGAISSAFAAAARQVAERRGQVAVHHALTVLRIADVGLLALLRARFPAATREVGRLHLAVLRDRVDEVLAVARKEGFTPRRSA